MEKNIISTLDTACQERPNKLFICWAKAPNEIYCHHAILTIEAPQLGLFDATIAEITLEKIVNLIEKSQIKGTSTITLKRFLPFIHNGNKIQVPLNDDDLITMLTLDAWTKGKDGKKLQIKEAPKKLTLKVNDSIHELNFNPSALKTPYLLIEKSIDEMSIGDTINQTIMF